VNRGGGDGHDGQDRKLKSGGFQGFMDRTLNVCETHTQLKKEKHVPFKVEDVMRGAWVEQILPRGGFGYAVRRHHQKG